MTPTSTSPSTTRRRRRALHGALVLLAAAFALSAVACDHDLDAEGRVFQCETDDDCLPGYECFFANGRATRVCALRPSADASPDVDTSPDTACGDTTTDPLNCGACGVECGDGEQCVAGECTCGDTVVAGERACPQGQACCDGLCKGADLPACDGCVGNGPCATGEVCCADLGGCSLLTDNPRACGGCAIDCEGGATACLADTCTAPAELTAGTRHACTRYGDGRVLCWGAASAGQLGYAPANDEHRAPSGFVDTELRFVHLAAGDDATCGVTTDDALVCFGATGFAGLTPGATPAAIDLGATPLEVRVSPGPAARYACVRTDDALLCLGDNDAGQLGHTGTEPGPAFDLDPAGAFAVGTNHACADADHGGTRSVWCWGTDDSPALGPDAGQDAAPYEIPLSGTVVQLSAGNGFSCALLDDGTVSCWGSNSQLQLGIEGMSQSATPVQVALEGSCSATALVSSVLHSCVLCDDGQVQCWGSNAGGQLGLDTATTTSVPTAVANLTASSVQVGGQFTCATRADDDRVLCWGANDNGQLGIGSTQATPSPTAVAGP